MGVTSLPKTVIRQRSGCNLNPGPSAPESSMLTTRLPSHPCESDFDGLLASRNAQLSVFSQRPTCARNCTHRLPDSDIRKIRDRGYSPPFQFGLNLTENLAATLDKRITFSNSKYAKYAPRRPIYSIRQMASMGTLSNINVSVHGACLARSVVADALKAIC